MIDPRFRHLRILESQLKETTTQINKVKSELGEELHRLGVEVPENLSSFDDLDSVFIKPRTCDSAVLCEHASTSFHICCS